MTSRVILWASNNNKLPLLFGVCVVVIVSTLTVGSMALAQNSNSYSTRASHSPLDPLNSSMKDYFRLPRHISPKNYNFTLWPDMNKKTFNGTVSILLEISEPTSKIQLHSNKLEIHSVFFREKERHIAVKSTTTTSDKRELLIIELFEEVPEGTYNIHLSYDGKLDGIVGFYASNLKNKK